MCYRLATSCPVSCGWRFCLVCRCRAALRPSVTYWTRSSRGSWWRRCRPRRGPTYGRPVCTTHSTPLPIDWRYGLILTRTQPHDTILVGTRFWITIVCESKSIEITMHFLMSAYFRDEPDWKFGSFWVKNLNKISKFIFIAHNSYNNHWFENVLQVVFTIFSLIQFVNLDYIDCKII